MNANEFEFLRDLPLGQYIPGESVIHRLDPRTRILAVTAFLLALTFEPHTLGLVIALIASLAGWALAGISPKPAWRGWKAALPFLLILALIQVIFSTSPASSPTVFVVLGRSITQANLLAGANLILRFSSYMAVLSLASATLSSSDLTRGLTSLLRPLLAFKIPIHDFAMVIQVTLRFFPLLAQTAERIAKGQASRGADWEAKANFIQRIKQRIPLLVPLFVISLRRAETLALAMDARGYASSPNRSSMIELKMKRGDWLALFIVAVVIFLVIWL